MQALLAAAIPIVGTDGCAIDIVNDRLRKIVPLWEDLDMYVDQRKLLAEFGVDTKDRILQPHFFKRFEKVFHKVEKGFRCSASGVSLSRHF